MISPGSLWLPRAPHGIILAVGKPPYGNSVRIKTSEVLLFLKATLRIVPPRTKQNANSSNFRLGPIGPVGTDFVYNVAWEFLYGEKIVSLALNINGNDIDEQFRWATMADPVSPNWFMTAEMRKQFLYDHAPKVARFNDMFVLAARTPEQ
jgi:hypothetical protein